MKHTELQRVISRAGLNPLDRSRMLALVSVLDGSSKATVAAVHAALFPDRTRNAANRALHRLQERVQAVPTILFQISGAKCLGAEGRTVYVQAISRRYTAAEMGVPEVDALRGVELRGFVLR
jgi:hypothetical protein